MQMLGIPPPAFSLCPHPSGVVRHSALVFQTRPRRQALFAEGTLREREKRVVENGTPKTTSRCSQV